MSTTPRTSGRKKRDVVAVNDCGIEGVVEGTRVVHGCRIRIAGQWFGTARMFRFDGKTVNIRVHDVYALEYAVWLDGDKQYEIAHWIKTTEGDSHVRSNDDGRPQEDPQRRRRQR